MHVNDLLKAAVERGASDLRLNVGSLPMARIHGNLVPVTDERRLDHEGLVEMVSTVSISMTLRKSSRSVVADRNGNRSPFSISPCPRLHPTAGNGDRSYSSQNGVRRTLAKLENFATHFEL
jgi:hypothetical protein